MVENLSLYRVFQKVAQCGSISAAARELYLTQPAVSAQIRALEEELHTRLFFRTGRGVSLTPQGEMLLGYIGRAFMLLENGEDKLRDIAGLRDGILRIGASDMTLRFYLLDHLQKFHGMYPGVRLYVTNAPTPDTLGALRAGQIDFGVISGPAAWSDGDDIRITPVRRIRDIFIERAENDDTAESCAAAPVTAEELLARPLILLESHTSTRRYIDAWFSSNCGGKTPTAAIELATSDLILAFVQRGIGVGCIVEDFALDAIAAGHIRRIPLEEEQEIPERSFCLVTLKHLPLSAAAAAFLAQLGVGDC